MTWPLAATLGAATVLSAAAAFVDRPHDQLAAASAVAAVLAISLLAAGTARRWYSYPVRPAVNAGIAVGPTLLITFVISHFRHGAWVSVAISFEAFIVTSLVAATWLRGRRRSRPL